jgi:hypothetical protein
MTTCVVLQPSYIPWIGVFQLMAKADVYIHYDNVQYDKRGWRNRNRLRFAGGSQWISIPVSLPNVSHSTLIGDVRIADSTWPNRHLVLIRQALGSADHFSALAEEILPELRDSDLLINVTIPLLEYIAQLLNVRAVFRRSSEFLVAGNGSERLVQLCQEVGASVYLTGPAARNYLDESLFSDNGIRVEWMQYTIQPYRQLHGSFDPYVSVLDPIANLGIAGARGLAQQIV